MPEEGIVSYYMWLWATVQLLEIELKTSGRAVIYPSPSSTLTPILLNLAIMKEWNGTSANGEMTEPSSLLE